ncbi:ATP synthase subunit I [Pseudomonas sp. HK3]
MSQTIKRPPVYRITLFQLGLSGVIALLFMLKSQEAAISALAGGLICAVPNAYFIHKAFKYSGAQQMGYVLRSFYQGGTWKIVLTAIGFVAAFKLIHPIDFLALFSAFIAVQVANVFASRIANL